MSIEITVTVGLPGAVPQELETILADLADAKDFGAICNAIVTEAGTVTSGADDTEAIQAALNAAATLSASTNPNWELPIGLSVDWDLGDSNNKNNLPQGTAKLPPGVITRITNTLYVPAGVRFDLNGSVLVMTGTGTAVSATYPDVDVSPTQKNYTAGSASAVVNGFIWGPGENISQGVGLDMSGQGYLNENLVIGGFLCGTRPFDSQYSQLTNVYCIGNKVNGLFTGSDGGNGCIDMNVRNCRFAKGGGYGLWMHHCTNMTLTQVDTNFCGRADYVFGPAVPDGFSRIITITQAGAGYTDGTYPLVVSDSQGSGFQATVTIGGGVVTSANFTDGIGVGSGLSSASFTYAISAKAGSPSTPAQLTLNPVRDATGVIGSLVNVSHASSAGGRAGLINFIGAKAETAGPSSIGETSGAPDCGYQCVIGGGDSLIYFHNRTFSSYDRGLSNYYRHIWVGAGALHDYDPEFGGNDGILVNPAVPGDISLWRVINGVARIRLPHNTFSGDIASLVIDGSGGPAQGGQVYVETTHGNLERITGLAINSGATLYGGNTRLNIENGQLVVDGAGNLTLTGGLGFSGTAGSSRDVSLSRMSNLQIVCNGYFVISSGSGLQLYDTATNQLRTARITNGVWEIN